MFVPYNVNEIPLKTLIFAKEELNEILNNRNEFNLHETLKTIKYVLELIKYSSLVSEGELIQFNYKLLLKLNDETCCECLKDMVNYIDDKIKIHNFHEMIMD